MALKERDEVKIKIKKNVLARLTFCSLILLLLSGCLGGREINDLEIVVGLGVDKDKNPGSILLTAQVVKPEEIGKSSNTSGDKKAFWNVNSVGESIFEAVREMTHKTGNRLFVSHSQAVIFGHDISSEGLQKYIDFFLRAHEMRPTTLIIIAEGTASDILDVKPETENMPAVKIAELVKSYGFTSQYFKVNMNDFAKRLLSTTTAPIAPIARITNDKDNKVIQVSGMAVFKDTKMIGTLNQDETRGLLWVLGKVKSGIIHVPSPDEQGIAVLEIAKAKSKATPEIRGGKIFINIEIKEESSLSEQSTPENLATIPAFEKLQKNQSEVIKKEILAAFQKSKELKSDVFGFGDMLQIKYSKEWKTLKEKWDEIYPTIEMNIDIETKIQKTDLLTRPAVPKKGE